MVFGNSGNDTIYGDVGNDTISGGRDDDQIVGWVGDDFLFGNLGNDSVNGGDGNDTVFGGQNDDWIFGEDGDDWISGDQGFDLLIGEDGDDWISGGDGDDWISGDQGFDTLIGGAGADLFFVASSGASQDVIADFELGVDDVIFPDGLTEMDVQTRNSEGNTEIIRNGEVIATLLGVEFPPILAIAIPLPTQEPDRTNIGSLIRDDTEQFTKSEHSNKWAGNSITFSVVTESTAATYPLHEGLTAVVAPNENFKVAIRSMFKNMFEPVISMSFVEVAETDKEQGSVRIMLGAIPGESAYSYLPENEPISGDVFLSTKVTSDAYTKVGTYEYKTVFHEVGHALGLNHPGNYNAGEAVDPNAKGPFVPIWVDNVMNTVMSYNFNWDDSNVTTLMPYDIRALQYMYGKNTSFNSTDTTYTLNFNTATLNDASNADMNSLNLNLAGKRTIWDAGGKDTLNAMGLPTDNYYFDLNPGGLLTAQSARNTSTYEGQDGQTYPIDRCGIRLAFDMQIENLLGTGGNDEVVGNTSDNLVDGGDGNDLLVGGQGNDTLLGGVGNDTLSGDFGQDVLTGGTGADIFKLRSIASTTELTQADVITDFEVTTDSISLSTGVTQVVEDTTLNGVTGSLIRNASDRSILGFVNNVFSSQLATRFVISSL